MQLKKINKSNNYIDLDCRFIFVVGNLYLSYF